VTYKQNLMMHQDHTQELALFGPHHVQSTPQLMRGSCMHQVPPHPTPHDTLHTTPKMLYTQCWIPASSAHTKGPLAQAQCLVLPSTHSCKLLKCTLCRILDNQTGTQPKQPCVLYSCTGPAPVNCLPNTEAQAVHTPLLAAPPEPHVQYVAALNGCCCAGPAPQLHAHG
jgi:hypothetical protein